MANLLQLCIPALQDSEAFSCSFSMLLKMLQRNLTTF